MKRAKGVRVRNLETRTVTISLVMLCGGCLNYPSRVQTNPAVKAERPPHESFSRDIKGHSQRLFYDGEQIFRYVTFGSELYWGDQLHLHEAILGQELGGVGPGMRMASWRWSWSPQ